MADAARFDKNMAAISTADQLLHWLPVPHPAIRVQGLGFFARESAWCRLPASLFPLLRDKRPALPSVVLTAICSRRAAGGSLRA